MCGESAGSQSRENRRDGRDRVRKMRQRVITGREAAALIPDKSTVALSGFIGFGLAEEVLCAMEEAFLETGHPRGLNLISVAGLGGDGKSRGFNHFGHPGMVGRLYASNLSKADKLAYLVHKNEFPAYLLPQGVLAQQFRAIAGKKPGVVSRVGLHTFVDPRVEGARANRAARDAAAISNCSSLKASFPQARFPCSSQRVPFITATSTGKAG